MKIKVKKKDILDALSKIQGITGRKSNLSITENVLIKSGGSEIKIQATDLETGFEGFYPANVINDGIVALNSRKLFEIVKNYPNEDINISEDENRRVKIGGKKINYNIPGRDYEDFPDIPIIEDIDFFSIESLELKRMIEQTIMINASVDEKRAHILGVLFECVQNEDNLKIQMVSTDGKRLARSDYQYNKKEKGLQPGKKVLIPKKGLSEIIKFLESEDNVQIGVKDNNFVVSKDKETMILNILEGSFPEFEKILTFDKENVLLFNKSDFKMLVRRMSILTSGDYKGVFFDFSDNNLVVTTANPDLGESREIMEIEYKKDPFKVAFNPQFFIDTLNFIESDNVLMNIKDEENPCLIKGEKEDSFLSVIMPMKI